MITVLGMEWRPYQSGQGGLFLGSYIWTSPWIMVKEDLGKNILNTLSAKGLKQGNFDVLVRKK